jgi:hypothetical protein
MVAVSERMRLERRRISLPFRALDGGARIGAYRSEMMLRVCRLTLARVWARDISEHIPG